MKRLREVSFLSLVAHFILDSKKRSSMKVSLENELDFSLEKTLDNKSAVSEYKEPPCCWKQAAARMKSLETQEPCVQPMDEKHHK